MNDVPILNRIRQLAKEKNVQISALEKACGVSLGYFSRQQDTDDLKLSHLIACAEVLKVPVNQLIYPKEGKVAHHAMLCKELNDLYARKNADYGDSFGKSFEEEGLAMARIRLGDKFNRFKTLSRSVERKVLDESIRDTLIDLANYALMTVLEMEAACGEGD